MRVLVGILVVLFSISAVYSTEIQEYRAEAVIQDTSLMENVTLVLLNTQDTPLTDFVYPFDPDVRGVKVYDEEGLLKSQADYRTGKTYVAIEFRDPVLPGEETLLVYQFTRPSAVSVYDESSILSITHSLLANVKNFAFTLELPEGYGLPEEGVNVVPKANDVRSDGRRVIIEWNIKEPIPSEFREFRVSVRYERLGDALPPYAFLLAGTVTGILVLLLIYRIYTLYSRLKKGGEERPDITEKIDILKEDEQAILKLIIDQEGIEQRKVQDMTGFSKAKVSKIISELEKRNAIRKEQIGRKNKLYLTEKLKET